MFSLLLIVKNSRFLFFKRHKEDVSYASTWGLPGGSVESGETPVEGLIRELQEELCMDITEFTLLKKYKRGNSKIINIYYLIDDEFDETQIRLNHEHTEYRYFTYKEILEGKEFIPGTIEIINYYIKNYYSKEYIVGN